MFFFCLFFFRWSITKSWCRAVVLEADDDKKLATIKFIDYGNQEVLKPLLNLKSILS